MSGFYDTLCNMLIRPARQTYSDYDLGILTSTKALLRWAHMPSGITSPLYPPSNTKSKPASTNNVTQPIRLALSISIASTGRDSNVPLFLGSSGIHSGSHQEGLSFL